ncbi:MAG: aspartyl protease family protein [Myxococcales bacterium]|nr:aspartyl protease family protein [Myxococcales bacterium]
MLWGRAVGLAAFAIGLAACGPSPDARSPHSRRAAHPTVATATPDEAGARRAKLIFRVDGEPFPLPLVAGKVAGHPTKILIDSGASSHVVAGWLARSIGLSMKKLGDIGTDHVGKQIQTFRVEGAKLSIDGWGRLAESPVIAMDVPEVAERLGIGAIVSPQQLARGKDGVVLDMRAGVLRTAPFVETAHEMAGTGSPLVTLGEARVCEDRDSAIPGLSFVIPATIDGQRANLLLDTGAHHSDLFASSAAGQKLGPRSVPNRDEVFAASGKVARRVLYQVKLAAGSFAATADVDLILGAPDRSCARDGALAMDVLKSCVLLFGRGKLAVTCGPAEDETPDGDADADADP